MNASRDMILCLVVFFGLCGIAHCGTGCCPIYSAPKTPQQQYEAAIIECAATSGYPGAYDYDTDMRCRNAVDCKFHMPSCHR